MDDQTAAVIGAIVVLVIFIALIKGAIKTFQRNWILALILLLLLTPIWLIWAFVEMFTGEIEKNAAQPSQNVQNVNVSYVVDGARNGSMPLVTSEAPSPLPKTSFDSGGVVDAEAIEVSAESDTKECPYCAEKIRRNAVYCRFCTKELANEQ